MSQPTTRPAARWAAVSGVLCSIAVATAMTASAATGPTGRSANSTLVPLPVAASDNIELLSTLPIPAAISLEFSRTGDFAYVSSLSGIYVLDLTDPERPLIASQLDTDADLLGVLGTVNFENESMTYGEREDAEGNLERFVILAIDIVEAGGGLDPGTAQPGSFNAGGLEIAIIDVTDPVNPFLRSRAEATTSTHTTQCVDQADCDFAYTAGEGSEFSIMDLRDLDEPKELKTVPSPASGPGGSGFASGAGHYWDFDTAGLGWHTGSGGAAVFDVSDPENPALVNATNAQGREVGLNDFILHNSRRINADAFTPGAPPSIANGNVLLVTEEDYANEGDEVVCENAGSFQTWHIKDLDADKYAAAATAGGGELGKTQDVGTIANLDSTNAPAEFAGGLTTPVTGFCSAHWFDVHQDGFVAQGWYGAGMRIMDVRDPLNITQYGYVTTAATEVWDAYWLPERDDAGVITGERTDVVYTADAVRGVDVFRVDLEAGPDGGGAPPTGPVPGPTAPGSPVPPVRPGDGNAAPGGGGLAATGLPLAIPVLATAVLGTVLGLRRRRTA